MKKFLSQLIIIFACLLLRTFSEEEDPSNTLEWAILRLRKSLENVRLAMLDDAKLTNKACVEAIGDTCTDAEFPFNCT